MTTDKQARLRKLPKLIAEEDDFPKIQILAAELRRLLDEEAAERDIVRTAD